MIPPQPPTLDEKLSYLRTGRFKLYGMGLLSTVPLVYGMLAFSLMEPLLYWYAPFALLIAIYLTISLLIGFLGKDFVFKQPVSSSWPDVDIYIPTCGESLTILENTFKHAAAIDYPQKNIYAMDDSARDEVRMLADQYGLTYFTRPDRPRMKKAGNLRYTFNRTDGDLILILDADFAARQDILHYMVPRFDEEKLAILQTPQYFSVSPEMTWVEAGAGYIQEFFYRLIQVSRDTFGAAICVGSCAMYRRKALDCFGGTAEIAYSEDLHTGFNVLTDGWKVRYLPIPLAKGVCPDRLSSFFSQQYRWCMGSFSLFINPKFWTSSLTVMQKVCYLSGMLYYIATGLSVIVTPLPILILLYFMPDKVHWFSAAFAIPSFLYGTLAMSLWTNARWGLYYFRIRAVQPWAHLFAMSDRLLGSVAEWVPTNGGGNFSRFRVYQWAASSWSFLLLGLFVWGVVPKLQNGDFGWIPSGVLFIVHIGVSLSASLQAFSEVEKLNPSVGLSGIVKLKAGTNKIRNALKILVTRVR